MTKQFSEVLSYGDETYPLHSFPLEAYFHDFSPRPELLHWNTALIRGYIGYWRIMDSSLYLERLAGYFNPPKSSDDQGVELTLRHLFPDAVSSVFAEWYSGSLRCPKGKLLRKRPFSNNIHQQELIIEIELGKVKSVRVMNCELFTEPSGQKWVGPAWLCDRYAEE